MNHLKHSIIVIIMIGLISGITTSLYGRDHSRSVSVYGQKERTEKRPRSNQFPPDLDIVFDIVYKTIEDIQLDMCMFKPLQKKYEKSPVVVYMHGGGWANGDKFRARRRDVISVIRELNHNGITCVSIEYRLTKPDGSLTPDNIVADCKDAVRFLVKEANAFGLDSERIGTFGTSAGGHLALMTALSDDQDFPCEPSLDAYKTKIKCAVAYYPLTSFVHPELFEDINFRNSKRILGLFGGPIEKNMEIARKVSPVSYVQHDSPPLFLAHGKADSVVSFKHSTLLRDVAQEKKVFCECIISEGAAHGFKGEDIDPSVQEINNKTVRFFLKYLTDNIK